MRWVLAAVVVVLLVLVAGFVAFGRGEEVPVEVEDVLPAPAAEEGLLPEPVAETRDDLLRAADAGDYDALAELAPPGFSYTFGGPVEGGPAAYWRELERTTTERPLETLSALLRLPYTLQGGIYTWPFAFDTPRERLTDYERELLAEAVDVDAAYAAGVGYAGWRTGIAPDGSWRFFVAGD